MKKNSLKKIAARALLPVAFVAALIVALPYWIVTGDDLVIIVTDPFLDIIQS